MKTYTFKVIDTNEEVHICSSTQRILDIRDGRHKQHPHCSDCDAIHYHFWEELTRQISPQIESVSGVELWNTFTNITCSDQYFLQQEDSFYILIYLHGREASDYLWVKCLSPYDPEKLSRPVDGLMFQLCDEEEHRACYVRRIGYSHQLVGISALKHSFALQAQASAMEIPESDYPDVILRIRMEKKVTELVRKHIYDMVTQFIQAWNAQADEYSKIHDVQLYDSRPDKYTVCVYVDFGNCDPAVLEKLFHYVIAGDTNVENITI